jgi:membrane-associated phospholipid phosphatase
MEHYDRSQELITEEEAVYIEQEEPTPLWARVISVLFHPLFMTTLLVAIIYYQAPTLVSPLDESTRMSFLFVVFTFTAVFPALSSYMLYRTRTISSLKMEKRQDRFLPLIFTSIIYIAVTYLFISQMRMAQVLVLAVSSITFSILLLAFATLYRKISAHCVGVGGVTAFLMALNYEYPESEMLYPIAAMVFISGLVASARLAVHAHTPDEVLTGYLMGFIVCGGAVLLF